MALEWTVLIVDDEGPIRSSLSDFLEDDGFITIQAESAEEGLSIVKNNPEINAAVVDIRLPGEDGNAFILQAHAIRPDMKFIIYTGSTDYSLPASVRKAGVDPAQVLHKPLQDIATLTTAIRRALGETD
ncbi:Response regulator receiver domain-containing protein [Desulfatibacillum alkenivorans DSM 16219]|jgi:DNA-binding NtrC family response regulator|uniref:Response regulator receiver domain-containing protein n=1 Tax=Desulfatibacillum alkenivorans DSM 16219 TaxID=1121393 RepID=A0A1M6HBC8_9BACT|nr:response regulator [Desulfatibacillum alkenivorans]SHJ19424.1 Response regulator receiver domain-containing protein [Desulfatibacillum alkenivorans DSM 16219]